MKSKLITDGKDTVIELLPENNFAGFILNTNDFINLISK